MKPAIAKNRRRFRRRLLGWAESGLRAFPWRAGPDSPYAILVAELLLKRTTSTAASRLYPEFLRKYPSLWALSRADEAGLVEDFAPVGLKFQRARDVARLASYLVEAEGGERVVGAKVTKPTRLKAGTSIRVRTKNTKNTTGLWIGEEKDDV